MKEVIGVRFRRNGRIYYFDPIDNEVEVGTRVVVETAKGLEYGWVVLGRREVDEERVQGGLKPIQRLASEQDDRRYETNREKSRRAYEICVEKIREHDLKMKLISAEYAFDNNKIMFYFTADGRVDFRELVKDLASVFRTRIELRQIGVRDESKMCGGIGICGRELCCHSYLSDFIPVSIKMAKEQNLSLNPTKISGVCGRLMCCLKHEQDTYEYLNSKLPNVGDRVTAYDGVTGDVASVNVLRQRVKIYVTDDEDNKELVEYRVEELVSGPRGRKFDTDESLLDPELSKLMDESGEEEKEERSQSRRRRKEGAGDGDGGSGRERGNRGGRGRGERGGRDGSERGGRDGSERGGRDGSERGGRDGSERGGRDGSERGGRDGNERGNRDNRGNRNRRDGGKKQEDAAAGRDRSQKGRQHPEDKGQECKQNHRRNHRPNRKGERGSHGNDATPKGGTN